MRTTQTANGRIELRRRRYQDKDQTSDCPADRLVDETESAVSVGAAQLCCREGINARSFDRGRENLKHAAQIDCGKELFRQIVESEGKAILKASSEEQLELDWSASDCKTQAPDGREVSRMYVSADGVLVPTTTQAEKDKRRATVKRKRQEMPVKQRRRLGKLASVKKGSDQRYKQVYVTCLYDQSHEHRLVGITAGKVKGLQRLLKREAARVRLRGPRSGSASSMARSVSKTISTRCRWSGCCWIFITPASMSGRPRHRPTRPRVGWSKRCMCCGTRDTARSSSGCWTGERRCVGPGESRPMG